MRFVLLLMISLLCGPYAAAAAAMPAETLALVAEVIDGNTIMLDRPVRGSRVVRLAGIEAPRSARGPGDESWPLAEDARRTLADLALGNRVHLSFEERAHDRYRRLLAQVHRADGAWLQGEMLKRGMARVRSLIDTRSRLAEMLTIEGRAREHGRGMWNHPFYRIRAPQDAEHDMDSFQIVAGVVLDRARVRDRIYLNFGPDWRTDFTVSIDTRLLPAFAKMDLDPMDLKGRRIRVRGWIVSHNGPLIEATHPEQIEVLPDRPPQS